MFDTGDMAEIAAEHDTPGPFRPQVVGGRAVGVVGGRGSVGRPVVPLHEAVVRSSPVAMAREHTLPLLPALAGLFPEPVLQRGTTVAVGGVGAASLALAVAAGPSGGGSWVATVGLPALGLVATAELGVAFERLAVIAEPPASQWGSVVASLIGAFDVVLVAVPRVVRAAEARRLAARSRERGTVLVVVDLAHALAGVGVDDGDARARARTKGVELQPDIVLRVTRAEWLGVGEGFGHLQHRRVQVEATGRRAAARTRRADLLLPGPDGQVIEVRSPSSRLRVGDPHDVPQGASTREAVVQREAG